MQLASAQMIVQALRFVRNVILARLLTPADFGVASTFWLTTGFLATLTQFGVEQMLIRDKDGDSEKLGATAQMFFLLRGAFLGCIIFLFAGPFMNLLGAPFAANSFRWIGLASILSGLAHRDTLRMQRDMRFGPSILAQLGPDVIVTALAWPIAAWFGDYSAFVVFSILQSFLSVVTSHLLAERRFRLGWDPSIARKCLEFGWPLLLNTMLMFFVLQGDRIVLAKAYTQAELGIYSVAISIALTPSMMLMSAASQLIVPALAKVQDSPVPFRSQYQKFLFIIGCFAIMLTGAFVCLGPRLIELIYGNKYALAGAVIGPLAFSQSIRLLRVMPTTAALAKGDTKNSLYSNLIRLLGFVAAVFVGAQHLDMIWIAYTCVFGEILALVFSVFWMEKSVPVGLRLHFYVVGLAFLCYALLTLIELPVIPLYTWVRISLSLVAITACVWLCSIPFFSVSSLIRRQGSVAKVDVVPCRNS